MQPVWYHIMGYHQIWDTGMSFWLSRYCIIFYCLSRAMQWPMWSKWYYWQVSALLSAALCIIHNEYKSVSHKFEFSSIHPFSLLICHDIRAWKYLYCKQIKVAEVKWSPVIQKNKPELRVWRSASMFRSVVARFPVWKNSTFQNRNMKEAHDQSRSALHCQITRGAGQRSGSGMRGFE